MNRGFTVLEVITCVFIIAIVTGLLTPVFNQAKNSGRIESSISNLHQMSVALLLYQSNQGGGGTYGSLSDMGLPDGLYVLESKLDLPLSVWQSPCGQNPSWEEKPVVIQYEYFPQTSLDSFSKISPIYQENSTMFVDMNCAEHGEPLYSDFFPHRGLGVLLSGTLLNLFHTGDMRRQKWWDRPVAGSDLKDGY